MTGKIMSQFCNLTPVKGSIKHDDYVDCLAIGISHLKEELKINLAMARRKESEQRLEDELRSIEEVRSYVQKNPSWISV